MVESDFGERLSALCARETTEARGDAERSAAMVERLAAALGFTVAIVAGGDKRLIDHMLTGAEGYAHEEAVSTAPVGRKMADLARRRARRSPDTTEGE